MFRGGKLFRIPARRICRNFSENEKFISESIHSVLMPKIMDAKDGVIDKWLKNEGETFNKDEDLCEVSLHDFSIAINAPRKGILVKKLVERGKPIEVGNEILLFAVNKEAYLEYVDSQRLASNEAEHVANIVEMNEIDNTKKPDHTVMLKEIKNMIKNGIIEDGSELAQKLRSLARKENNELLNAFISSFEIENDYSMSNFDYDDFIEDAKEIIKEQEEK